MISALALILLAIAALLAIALLAIALSGSALATRATYAATLIGALFALAVLAIRFWSDPLAVSLLTLPLGLPWLGAHFRLDALAAFFLFVVNLGGAATSLYGLGYGRAEAEPHRILPFFPAFLAAMTLVVIADDAFTFLFAWEFMSLA